MKNTLRAWLFLALSSLVLPAMSETPETAESLQLMVGAPPLEERQVTVENALVAPYNRWSFQRMRNFPDTGITLPPRRLRYPPTPLRSATSPSPSATVVAPQPALAADAYTDGFIVLHNGRSFMSNI